MAHRADQIVEAAAAAARARLDTIGARTFTHRRMSLSADQDELPAVSVDIGPEEGVSQNTQYIDSRMRMAITAVVAAPSEPDARRSLLSLRREVHRALMADETLGLSFVVSTTFGRMEDVQTETDGESIVFSQSAIWLIYYRMNVLDPGDGA